MKKKETVFFFLFVRMTSILTQTIVVFVRRYGRKKRLFKNHEEIRRRLLNFPFKSSAKIFPQSMPKIFYFYNYFNIILFLKKNKNFKIKKLFSNNKKIVTILQISFC